MTTPRVAPCPAGPRPSLLPPVSNPRTSVLDVLMLAWRLIRLRKERQHMRIGQILVNRANDRPPLFYVENLRLIDKMAPPAAIGDAMTKPHTLNYTILLSRSIEELIIDVNRLLDMDQGTRWQAQGGVSVAQTAEGQVYLQAMVLR